MKPLFLLPLLYLLLSPGPVIEKNKWNDFEGTVGEAPIQLSLFLLPDNEVKGNYCYKKLENRIQLKGKVFGDSVLLTEYLGTLVNGTFAGKFSGGSDTFEGTWMDKTAAKKLPFRVKLTSITSGTASKRYDLGGTDAAVEAFVKRMRTSIMKDNKEWVAAHVQYPIKVKTVDGKNLLVKNDTQLIKEFDRIFHQEFKESLKKVCACNMFSNYEGVMIGNGLIWIANSAETVDRKIQYVIISINN